jgi:hypothetical protein
VLARRVVPSVLWVDRRIHGDGEFAFRESCSPGAFPLRARLGSARRQDHQTGMHLKVDPAVRYDVVVGIAAPGP